MKQQEWPAHRSHGSYVNIGRRSGILLHVTSLPGRFGIGDLGPSAYRFVDFLAAAKQRLWCVLPLGPIGTENSPYQSPSAFAGNPLLVSPELLTEQGYLSQKEFGAADRFSDLRVNFPAVRKYKADLLEKAFQGFSETKEYRKFVRKHDWWLDVYARFMSLREANDGANWTKFDPWIKPSAGSVAFHKFVQFEFFRQWQLLRKYCAQNQVAIMGDMPFYVEHNSADVWSNRDLFNLDKKGNPRTVGGVPPDYFSENGQLWGTPTYRWDRMEETRFKWWIDRFRVTLETVDLLRLDHFRGFQAFWSVDARRRNARIGRWRKSPGVRLLATIRKELGDLPFVAENLGIITPEVESLRQEFGLPGMAVLQFGFDENGSHRPNNYVKDLVSFTGTHDNDTTRGWWNSLRRAALKPSHSADREAVSRVKAYLQNDGQDIHWSFIQAILTSVADIAITPMQDVLGLGSEARLNFPGRAKGNWHWRIEEKQLSPAIVRRLRDLTEVAGR